MILLLQGIRILEVGSVVLGPMAGQILADLGAEVIKIESVEGDVARASYPQGKGGGALFLNNNRNKRMVSLDLKREEGRDAFRRLLKTSDVLLHNMRIDAASRLGLDFASAAAVHPQIIHCAAIGFGQRGRYRDRPAFDDIIQAASGLAGLTSQANGDPQFIPTILADKVAALHVVYGILAALVSRTRGNREAISVEVPMFESMASFVLNEHLAGATFEEDGAVGYPRVLAVDRRPFRTSDGWIAVLPYTGKQWREFLSEVGHSHVCDQDWFGDPSLRQSRIDELYAIVAEVLPRRTTADWIAVLSARDIPCSEINTLDSLLTDPHLLDIGFFDVPESFAPEFKRVLPQAVEFSGVGRVPDTAPAALGKDTKAVLLECGYEIREVDALIVSGAAFAANDDRAAKAVGAML